MPHMEHGTTVDAEKASTSYKWIMKDWSLLHLPYYSKVQKSPEFVLTNTGGSTCQLSLIPYFTDSDERAMQSSGSVTVFLKVKIDYLSMQASVSLLDKTMKKKLIVQSAFGKPFPSSAEIKLGMNLTKNGMVDYLINDTLILLFELTIVKSINVSSLQTESYSDTFTTGMRENLKKIRENKSLCDVTFVIGEQELYAHKVILAANSAVFEAMFTSGMVEEEGNKVQIVDIDDTVFEEFLNYLYTGRVTNLEAIVDDLIVVADKYQVNDLMVICENFMSAYLDHANVVKYLLIADKLRCEDLKAEAIIFVKVNMQVLAKTTDYKLLFEYPKLIEKIFDL